MRGFYCINLNSPGLEKLNAYVDKLDSAYKENLDEIDNSPSEIKAVTKACIEAYIDKKNINVDDIINYTDSQIKDFVDAAIKTNTVSSKVFINNGQILSSTGKQFKEGTLIKRIVDTIQKLDVKINIDNTQKNNTVAKYNAKTNTITVSSTSPYMSDIAHEMIHAITYYYLNHRNPSVFDKKVQDAIQDIKDSWEIFNEYIAKNKNEYNLNTSNELDAKLYGLTDVNEFIAEAFSNPVFRSYLKEFDEKLIETIDSDAVIKGKKGSLWTRIKNAIKTFLGITTVNENVIGKGINKTLKIWFKIAFNLNLSSKLRPSLQKLLLPYTLFRDSTSFIFLVKNKVSLE